MKRSVAEAIEKRSIETVFPDKDIFQTISVDDVIALSDSFSVKQREIEIFALENNIIPNRYARNMKSFSCKDQTKLLKSKVSIAGLGGLGGAVVEMLARSGIGCINLIDGDNFDETNLNRQLISCENLLGVSKTQAAKKRIANINSSVEIFAHPEFLDQTNARNLLEGSDIVIDCLDNIKTRFVIEKISRELGIPFVSAAIAGFSGHVMTVFPEDDGICTIYGHEEDAPQKGAEDSTGNLSATVMLIAACECAEVYKILLNKGRTLRKKFLAVDLIDNTFEIVRL